MKENQKTKEIWRFKYSVIECLYGVFINGNVLLLHYHL